MSNVIDMSSAVQSDVTPTPALAPQDGVREAAHDLVEARKRGALLSHRFRALEAALAAPSDPDVLPGLKLALELTKNERYHREVVAALRAEIARREGASK